jgi:hypothetical protein
LANTFEPDGELKLLDGDQLYDVPFPEAKSEMEMPLQIVVFVGDELIKTVHG